MRGIFGNIDVLELIMKYLTRNSDRVAFMNVTPYSRKALIGQCYPLCRPYGCKNTRLVSDFIGHIKYNASLIELRIHTDTPVNMLFGMLKEFCPLSPMPPRMLAVTMAVHIVGTIAFTLWTDGIQKLCVRISRELGQFLKTLASIFNNPTNRDAITSRIIGKTVNSGGYSQRVLNDLGIVSFTTQDADGNYMAHIYTLPGYIPTGTTVNLVARINVQYKTIQLIAG
jgi:hypothetical protein